MIENLALGGILLLTVIMVVWRIRGIWAEYTAGGEEAKRAFKIFYDALDKEGCYTEQFLDFADWAENLGGFRIR